MSSTMADEVRCFSPTFLPGGITASLMTMIPSPHWPPSARDCSFFHRICLPSFCSILSPSTKIPRRKPLFFPLWEFLDFPREVSISWIPCPWPATAGGSNFPSMPDGGLQVSPPGFFRVPSLNRSSIHCLRNPSGKGSSVSADGISETSETGKRISRQVRFSRLSRRAAL